VIINDPSTLAEVTEAFARYERALMENDLATLDALFWNSPQTLRYGVGENLYGFDAIREFRAQRPGGSPPRVLRNTVITTYGTDFATAKQIGRQSQCWARMPEGWRIVAAHVSMMSAFS
jgi:hypothetical protein